MKTILSPTLLLTALLAAGGATPARAAGGWSFWHPTLYSVVVAEQPRPENKFVPPTADHPAYYAIYDGGYIEAGDPIANERPPAAAAVAQALARSLAPRHYLPATDRLPPSVLLLYHWGVLNRSSTEIRNSLELGPNQRARIALVAPAGYARRIEQDLLDERTMREAHSRVWFPYFLDFHERDILELSRDDRFFVVVSAYDYAALARRQAKLLWRAKMSARSAGVAMADALPALLRSGAPYFGQNLRDPQYVNTPEVREGRVEVGVPRVVDYLPPPAVAHELAGPFVRRLANREHRQFAGDRGRWASRHAAHPPPAGVQPAS
jgi:hypothetical protein